MFLLQNEYAVRINGCPLWKEHSSVTFGMCMGNSNWEGAKFGAILEWAARHFGLIRIALSDTLGRHNYLMRGLTPEEAVHESLAQGDLWLREHMNYLRLCGRPYQIVRWDTWRHHPEFNSIHECYRNLALHDENLSKLLDASIQEHLERLRIRGGGSSSESYQHCFEYLVEELAGTTLRARTFGRSCRLYPAPEPEWLELVRNRSIVGAPFGLEHEYYVAINLRRRKEPFSKMRSIIESKLLHHAAA